MVQFLEEGVEWVSVEVGAGDEAWVVEPPLGQARADSAFVQNVV